MNSEIIKDRFIGAKEAAKILGVSIATFYRYAQNGTFPKRIPITETRKVWSENQIYTFLDALKKQHAPE